MQNQMKSQPLFALVPVPYEALVDAGIEIGDPLQFTVKEGKVTMEKISPEDMDFVCDGNCEGCPMLLLDCTGECAVCPCNDFCDESEVPEYGFTVREDQIKLSQDMYLGLTGKQVAICEAEVGTGKTLAYLIASFVAKERYAAEYGFNLPVTISTSSIELQKMIVEKEVPQLSRMLQDYGLIKHPLCAVVRKGKEHYFCKARYYDYLSKIMDHKEKYRSMLDYFTANKIAVRAFDLDLWDMPAAIKGKVCVKGRCSHCEYRDDCRYSCYVKAANDKGAVDFQVTNHNMFLTSIKASDGEATSGIIQRSPYVVIDEAHKLLEAAQATFGEQFSEGMIQKYINSVRYLKSERVKEDAYNYFLDKAKKTNQQLFAMTESSIRDIIKRRRCICGAELEVSEDGKTGNSAYLHILEELRYRCLSECYRVCAKIVRQFGVCL